MPPIITPTPFKEAVAKLSNKVPVKADLSSKEWSNLPAELREAAFFSAHVESAKFLGSAQNFLGDYLQTKRVKAPDGSTMLKAQGREQFVRDMREKMQAWGMPVSGTEVNDITDKSSVGRLRLIFETQVAQANEYGRFKVANESEAIRRAFPAQRFVRLAGKKDARPVHSAHTGEVRLKTDLAFWLAMNAREIGGFGVPRGPWGFNSGMGTEDVGRSEAIALGLVKKDDPTPDKIPDDGFLAGMQASTANIPPEVMAQLEKAMGPKMKKKGADAIAPAPVAPVVQEKKAATDGASIRERFAKRAAASPQLDQRELMLESIREGRTPATGMKIEVKTRDREVIAKTRSAEKFVNEIVHHSLTNGITFDLKKSDAGARYIPEQNACEMRAGADVSIFVHELMHVIEAKRPGVLANLIAFRSLRGAGASPVSLAGLMPQYRNYPEILTVEDKWVERGHKAYVGRIYKRRDGVDFASEVLSMGMERLHKDPVGFARDDPEYFDFILNLTAGTGV